MLNRKTLLFRAWNKILRFDDLPGYNGDGDMSESDLESGIRCTLDRAKKWVEKEYSVAIDLHTGRLVVIKEAENLLNE